MKTIMVSKSGDTWSPGHVMLGRRRARRRVVRGTRTGHRYGIVATRRKARR